MKSFYEKAAEGVLNCTDITVFDIEAWRREEYEDYGEKVILAKHYGWFYYVVLGRALTILSDIKLKLKNRKARKMAKKNRGRRKNRATEFSVRPQRIYKMVDIRKLRMTKPSWATDPEPLDFKVVDEPLEKLVKRTINTLERKARAQFCEFDFLAEKILAGCYQTYKAIRKLVAKDPKYPTQAHILNRSILDSLFVIEAFSEDPRKHPRAYALAGYRTIWEEYTQETQKYGNDPNYKEYLADKAKFLESLAKLFGLSEDEQNSPGKNIPYWPIPSRMLKDRIFSKNRCLFLKELYDSHYGWESALSHFQWGGMSAAIFSSSPEKQWHPGKFESDAVYKSILYLLMIISEIEAVSDIGIKQDIKYIWTIVGSYWGEAKEFYDKRFAKLLRD